MRNVMISLIRLYQSTFSPDHGPMKARHPYGYCPQEPSCSEFALRAIERRGAIVGLALAVKRVLGCHPWRRPSREKIAKVLARTS